MTRIVLTPHASLQWRDDPPGATSAGAGSPASGDWRQRLFALGAGGESEHAPEDAAAISFWRSFAETCISGLCRLSGGDGAEDALPPPAESRFASWLENAPPMPGGEYLSRSSLGTIWGELAAWCAQEAALSGGLAAFLEKRAPKWRRVGLVTFHLAENKIDENLPFVFLATYTVGLNRDGHPVHQVLGEALKRYAEEADKAALLSLLSPVRAAAAALPWVNDLVESGAVYRPQAFSVSQAHRMLLDLPRLESSGLRVSIPDWWRKRPKAQVRIQIGETESPALGLEALLNWNVGLALGDQRLDRAELEELFAAGDGLILFKGQWIEVDRDKLREALTHWESIRDAAEQGVVTFAQGMRLLAGMPLDMRAADEDAESGLPWPHVEASPALRELLDRMRRPENSDAAPASLQATLRPYQHRGLAWLALLSGLGLGACLADDMGLGKTVQVLALLLADKEQPGSGAQAGAGLPGQASPAGEKRPPSLLVVPASLLGNWRAETERFAPSLRLNFFHPAECGKEQLAHWEKHPDDLCEADLVVTSYTMLARNSDLFHSRPWRMVIADEAQNIKNPGTRQSRALKKMRGAARIALTGTPVENRLSDLWSLFDFINPGLLGSAKSFKNAVSRLEKREEDRYGPLRRLVSPYILRRLKTDRQIISDLPEKVESVAYCHLTPGQAALYSRLVEQLSKDLADLDAAPNAEGEAQLKRRGLVLQSITRLKQLCNHPAQLTGEPDWGAARSGKFARVGELCREMAERQERVLVFTQFREIIEPLSRHLEGIFGRPGLALHGGTTIANRKKLVDVFQRDDGPPFFLLSLKAGGTGLNLTAAGQVLHFDRWWNPAVEDQATDRAFRIGQKKNVLVHKCVTRGTLEERIDNLLQKKRGLAGEILDQGGEINLTALDDGALLDLLRLDINRAVL